MKESMLAIIPARGNSKRIPGKNIRLFAGKPMLKYAIDACLNSKLFDEVMVSTDSNEIANIAKNSGVEIPFMRSEKTASDTAIIADVIREVLNQYQKLGVSFQRICCVYPCVPFLTEKLLKQAYLKWKNSSADSLQTICRYPVPVEWVMRLENGILKADYPEKQLIRSQDLKQGYYDAGMFYFFRTESFLFAKNGQVNSILGFEIDESEVQDIDTEEDWKNAEKKYYFQRWKE